MRFHAACHFCGSHVGFSAYDQFVALNIGVCMQKILIVDDEPITTSLFGRHLRAEGYVTAEAHSARAALELLKTFQADLLITDRQMGEMSGDELIAIAKKILPNMPTIMVSSDNPGVYPPPQSCFFLSKPVAPSTLIDLVAILICKPTSA